MGMAWSQILNTNPFCSQPTAEPELQVSDADIDAFINATCMSLSQAESACRTSISISSEIEFRQSPLRAKPIIRVSEGTNKRYIRPIEQLLIWRITSGLYYDVIGDSRAANEIGSQYERYTRALLDAAVNEVSIDGDIEYGTKRNPQRSPDVILHKDGVIQAIFECKAKKLSLVVQNSVEDTKERAIAVNEIAKGLVQICQFEEAINAGAISRFRLGDNLVPLVVALDDWVFTGPDIKQDIYSRAHEIAVSEGLNTKRIDQRFVGICTATELDQLVSNYTFDVIKRITAKSFEEKYRDYALVSVANECFRDEKQKANYPLKCSLDEIIGL